MGFVSLGTIILIWYIQGNIRQGQFMIGAIMTALKKDQWVKYMNDVLRILKPGGWAQFTEHRGVHLLSKGVVPKSSPLREACASIVCE